MPCTAQPLERQRIDKWLWHARVVRTRSSAAALVEAGRVRINGQRTDAASQLVRIGDVLTVSLDRAVRVIKVLGFAERRGSAEIAASLCENVETSDRPAATSPTASPAARESGAGRPTKRERRAIERFTGDDD